MFPLFSKPLTFVNEKSQKKEAVGVFKLVQIYMSDRKAKVGMTVNSVAQEISDTGYSSPGLRDEVYIQLCKQVTSRVRATNRTSRRFHNAGESPSRAFSFFTVKNLLRHYAK